MTSKRSTIRLAAGVGSIGLAVLATAGPALASDSLGDQSSLGKIQLQNAAGVQITTGDIATKGVAAKAIAVGPTQRATSTSATLSYFTPTSGAAISWQGEALTASTVYNPATMYPTTISRPTDNSLADLICDLPANGTSNPTAAGSYQLRLKSTGPTGTDPMYYTASLTVSVTSGTCADGNIVGSYTQNDAPVGAATGPAPAPSLPEAPYVVLLPLLALTAGGALVVSRKRANRASL